MLLRRIARPLFATWFVAEGVAAARHPDEHVAALRQATTRLAKAPGADALRALGDVSDAHLTLAVRVHGAAMALAGLGLAVNRAPRVAALTLAVLTAPLAVAATPAPRSAGLTKAEARSRRARLVQAVSATGGALLAAADYEGRPGVQWRAADARARRAADRAEGAA